MTVTSTDTEELDTLKSEAEELKAKPRKPRTPRKPAATTRRPRQRQAAAAGPGVEPATSTQEAPIEEAAKSAGESVSTESERPAQDIAGQIATIVREMEEAATERPALALLSAFALGILVSQIFSRK